MKATDTRIQSVKSSMCMRTPTSCALHVFIISLGTESVLLSGGKKQQIFAKEAVRGNTSPSAIT